MKRDFVVSMNIVVSADSEDQAADIARNIGRLATETPFTYRRAVDFEIVDVFAMEVDDR